MDSSYLTKFYGNQREQTAFNTDSFQRNQQYEQKIGFGNCFQNINRNKFTRPVPAPVQPVVKEIDPYFNRRHKYDKKKENISKKDEELVNSLLLHPQINNLLDLLSCTSSESKQSKPLSQVPQHNFGSNTGSAPLPRRRRGRPRKNATKLQILLNGIEDEQQAQMVEWKESMKAYRPQNNIRNPLGFCEAPFDINDWLEAKPYSVPESIPGYPSRRHSNKVSDAYVAFVMASHN